MTDSRSWVNPKQNILKEIHIYWKKSQANLWKPFDWKRKKEKKKKNLDSSERNETLSKGEKAIQTIVDLPPETTEARSNDMTCLKCWKKRTVSSEFYIQGKLPQEWRKNQDFLEWLEAKRICHQQNNAKRLAKGSCINRKGMIKEGISEHKQIRKNTVDFSSWNLQIMLDA